MVNFKEKLKEVIKSDSHGWKYRFHFLNVRSTTTAGGGLANKISLCISRVLSNSQSNIENSEDLEDLIFLVQELNEHEELNVKLSSATKISKLLHDV